MGRKRIHVAGKPLHKPAGAGFIDTYDELSSLALKFVQKRYRLLVIAGDPGIGKTRAFLDALVAAEANYGLIEANASPYGAYVKCYEHRNQLIVIDDADELRNQPQGLRLLKQIGQTDEWKHLSWQTRAMMGLRAPAPAEFYTSSQVCVITNHWDYEHGNIHTAAVEDRGICKVFFPTSLEVYRHASTWFWDQEIFDFIGQHLPYLRKLTLRLFVKAYESKLAGDPWKNNVLDQAYEQGDIERVVLDLLSASAGADDFVRNGHGSRATFYRYKKDLEERVKAKSVPYYQLTRQPPLPQPDPMLDLFGDSQAITEGEDEDQDNGDFETGGLQWPGSNWAESAADGAGPADGREDNHICR
jgi:hypothetical protein